MKGINKKISVVTDRKACEQCLPRFSTRLFGQKTNFNSNQFCERSCPCLDCDIVRWLSGLWKGQSEGFTTAVTGGIYIHFRRMEGLFHAVTRSIPTPCDGDAVPRHQINALLVFLSEGGRIYKFSLSHNDGDSDLISNFITLIPFEPPKNVHHPTFAPPPS